MSYTMYTPLNVWLDPASVTDVVAYIQNYLSENTIYSEEEIEELIHDYLIAHPELIGGVQSVNGKTGTVVLSASDINTANNVTIESVLSSLSSQISSIASSVATNTSNITSLTGRVTTAETDISNLKSSVKENSNALVNNDIIEIPFTWEYGNINTSGADANNSATIYARTVGFFQPYQEMDVIITRTAGSNNGIVQYTLNGTFVTGGRSVFSSTPYKVHLNPQYKYRFFHNGDGTIPVLDLNNMIAYLSIKTNPVFITGKRLDITDNAIKQIRNISVFGSYSNANINQVNGKLYKINTLSETTNASGAYAIYTIGDNVVKAKATGYAWSDTTIPLYAVLDENNTVIIHSSLTDNSVHTEEFVLPVNAYKIVINGTTTNIGLEIFTASDINNAVKPLVIACTGDSVTEGMSTDGAHTADYDKDPYPAQLYTMLKDNGYDVTVLNQGHGGERIPDVCARIGAYACIFTEDVTVPGDGSTVSLGVATFTNGRVSGTKLSIPYADEQDVDYNVFFTQSVTTNPLTIDGINYTLSVVNDNENTIRKTDADGINTTIKAGTPLFTNNDRTPNINIVLAGINDLQSLTLERYINQMLACASANKGNYIILGGHTPIWNNWSDLSGTSAEKYNTYKRACLEKFGVNWIDLYAEFSQHALEYAIEGGYFTDLTEAQKTQIQSELNDKHIPGEFTYNGNDDDVHLNRIGYYVFAKIIYYRLIALNYV